MSVTTRARSSALRAGIFREPVERRPVAAVDQRRRQRFADFGARADGGKMRRAAGPRDGLQLAVAQAFGFRQQRRGDFRAGVPRQFAHELRRRIFDRGERRRERSKRGLVEPADLAQEQVVEQRDRLAVERPGMLEKQPRRAVNNAGPGMFRGRLECGVDFVEQGLPRIPARVGIRFRLHHHHPQARTGR
jgi:hypothetical protein